MGGSRRVHLMLMGQLSRWVPKRAASTAISRYELEPRQFSPMNMCMGSDSCQQAEIVRCWHESLWADISARSRWIFSSGEQSPSSGMVFYHVDARDDVRPSLPYPPAAAPARDVWSCGTRLLFCVARARLPSEALVAMLLSAQRALNDDWLQILCGLSCLHVHTCAPHHTTRVVSARKEAPESPRKLPSGSQTGTGTGCFASAGHRGGAHSVSQPSSSSRIVLQEQHLRIPSQLERHHLLTVLPPLTDMLLVWPCHRGSRYKEETNDEMKARKLVRIVSRPPPRPS